MLKIGLAIIIIGIAVIVTFFKFVETEYEAENVYSDDQQIDNLYGSIDKSFGDPSSDEFTQAFKKFIALAEGGHEGAVGMIAEIYSHLEPHKDIEKSYFWYYIHYANEEAYIMEYDNEDDTGEGYLGKNGDFRNEIVVNELINQLGIIKAKELEEKAKAYMYRKAKNTNQHPVV